MLNPLNKLLKEDAEWKWTTECEENFANVKKKIDGNSYLGTL